MTLLTLKKKSPICIAIQYYIVVHACKSDLTPKDLINLGDLVHHKLLFHVNENPNHLVNHILDPTPSLECSTLHLYKRSAFVF